VIASLEVGGATRRVDLSEGTSLAIPIKRHGQHPRFFVTEEARFETLSIGGFTGQVSAGGSCNVESIHCIPHCHGTHTEGVGHINRAGQAVQECLSPGLLPAALISVSPTSEHEETSAGSNPAICARHIEWPEWARALIIRTLPNDPDKCRRDYASAPPYPLLTVQAMEKIVAAGIEHLLIDTPSVDAADDGGRLLLHRIFWAMAPNQEDAGKRSQCTITEMIFVPDHLKDGACLLDLGISALYSDAASSNPTVYPLR
jgi:arylformamidase